MKGKEERGTHKGKGKKRGIKGVRERGSGRKGGEGGEVKEI